MVVLVPYSWQFRCMDKPFAKPSYPSLKIFVEGHHVFDAINDKRDEKNSKWKQVAKISLGKKRYCVYKPMKVYPASFLTYLWSTIYHAKPFHGVITSYVCCSYYETWRMQCMFMTIILWRAGMMRNPMTVWVTQNRASHDLPCSAKLQQGFNLVIWRIWWNRQIINSPILIIACVPMMLRIQITKYKFCQYLLSANSPNLILAKLSHYMVF